MIAADLNEYFHNERSGGTTHPLRLHLDARFKLIAVLAAIICNIWIAYPWLSVIVLVVGILLVVASRLTWRQQLPYLLVPLWPTLLIILGFAAGFGTTPIFRFGPLTFYWEGVARGGHAALRAYCDIIWLMGWTLTTPFPQMIASLRWLRVPEIIIDTLSMMYRYVFVLYSEFRRMRFAAQSRGGRSGIVTETRTLARIVALIFIRAFDRSERIYWAMVARGGELNG